MGERDDAAFSHTNNRKPETINQGPRTTDE
jgi:hypothetical protein